MKWFQFDSKGHIFTKININNNFKDKTLLSLKNLIFYKKQRLGEEGSYQKIWKEGFGNATFVLSHWCFSVGALSGDLIFFGALRNHPLMSEKS